MLAIQIAFFLPLSPSFVVVGLWWQLPWPPMVGINSLGDVTCVPAQTPLGEAKVQGQEAHKAPITRLLYFLFHPLAQSGEAA